MGEGVVYFCRRFPRSIFRAYDIRGIVDEQLDEAAYFSIGKAAAIQLKALGRTTAFLARDGRLSSERFSKALSEGLLQSGIHVIDLNRVGTPVLYYATHTQSVDSGFMVTGSHNPSNYNGIKMVFAGKTLVSQDIDVLYEVNQSGASLEGNGTYQTQDVLEAYLQRIISDVVLSRPLKVVVDCGNGVAGFYVPQLIEALGCEEGFLKGF